MTESSEVRGPGCHIRQAQKTGAPGAPVCATPQPDRRGTPISPPADLYKCNARAIRSKNGDDDADVQPTAANDLSCTIECRGERFRGRNLRRTQRTRNCRPSQDKVRNAVDHGTKVFHGDQARVTPGQDMMPARREGRGYALNRCATLSNPSTSAR